MQGTRVPGGSALVELSVAAVMFKEQAHDVGVCPMAGDLLCFAVLRGVRCERSRRAGKAAEAAGAKRKVPIAESGNPFARKAKAAKQ